MKKIITSLAGILLFLSSSFAQITPPAAFGPTPNTRQMKYLASPMAGFIHFGMNTFVGADGIEWGDQVKQPASVFNPVNGKVNTDQWVRLFKKAGFTRVIITLKHHDGFCLWPTKVTDYNISKSPYLNGAGDIAKELSLSCDKYDMDMGIYLSPWDAWEPSYGDTSPGDYNTFYDNQLRELLSGDYGRLNPQTGKREIVEIWLDGATGSGVAHQTYDFNRFVNTVRTLQPNCLTWMTLGAAQNYSGPQENFPVDAFWVGNERGYVNDPVWQKVLVNVTSVSQYNPNGQYFSVPEADVSIRPGWFYHASQDGSVKTLSQLTNDIYFRSVGMSIPLLLNVPPNKSGIFHANDSTSLMKFGTAIANTFKTNLITPDMTVSASEIRGTGFEAAKAIDTNYDTYWTMADGKTTGSITVDFGKDIDMDVIKVQEYIPLGQRISGWKAEVQVYGQWQEYGSGQTIGYQRFIKGKLLPVRKIRFTVNSSLAVPLINTIAAYHSDPSITTVGTVPPGIQPNGGDSIRALSVKKISKLKFEIVQIPSGKWPTLAEMKFYTMVNGVRTEIPRTGFTATATSEAKQVVNGEPDCLVSYILDGNTSSFWQPEWKPKVAMPQSITIDFGKQIECSEISYLPRQTTSGDIASVFNIYTAEKAADPLTLSLSGGTFSSAINTAQFTRIAGDDWTVMNNYGKYDIAIWSNKPTAKALLGVSGGWFRIIGTKSPMSGIMEVYVDGVLKATVDTYNAVEQKDATLYELNGLSADKHTVEVRVTGTKNASATDSKIILQTITTLQNGVKGMFEFTKNSMDVKENIGKISYTVRRYGALADAANITVITQPGTGVQGKTYSDVVTNFTFAAGEEFKTGYVDIIDNTQAEGNLDFFVQLSNPSDNSVLGFNSEIRVLVYDNDGDFTNPDLNGYCVPDGTQHSQMKTYLESATTTGATTNLNYQASVSPSTVYVKYMDTPIEVQRGSAFTLNLNAFVLSTNTTSVFQDLRYDNAYIYADWNADKNFTDDERIAFYGKVPPSDAVKGNYDVVMKIACPVTVPTTTPLLNIPLRVMYHNAWSALPTACSTVTDGMIYDFKMKILETTGLKNVVNRYQIYKDNKAEMIRCKGNFENGTRFNLINISGLVLKSFFISANREEVNIPAGNLAKGVYIVHVVNKNLSEAHKILI